MRIMLTRPAERAIADAGADTDKVKRWLGDWIIDHKQDRIYRNAADELYVTCHGGDVRRAIRALTREA